MNDCLSGKEIVTYLMHNHVNSDGGAKVHLMTETGEDLMDN